MRSDCRPTTPDRPRRRHRAGAGPMAALLLLLAGCEHKEARHYESVSKPPSVQLIRPEVRKITRVVGQPSFIEAYERTSIYPKLTGYIEKWDHDIGDVVKKGEVLAKLFVPELVEDFGTKNATVTLDRERIELARKLVEVADADVKAAQASLDESLSMLDKYQAEADRWDAEVKRLKREVDRGVVDPQVLLESSNQLRSSTAARDAAKATIARSEANLLSSRARLAKSQVDVDVAKADLSVAESEAKRIAAWVGYITLAAPYDGIVVARNANTGDFVMAQAGDPTALQRNPYEAPGGGMSPIFVVDRTDVVRIFVDIPESDANFVRIGTKATVLAKAYRDNPFPGTVTRTSWALNIKSRTLRAEIDLPNPNAQLLPGMYAYAKVIIERPDIRTLPVKALTHQGDKTFFWNYRSGKAVRTEIETGVSDGEFVEVTNRENPDKSNVDHPWTPIDGTEEVITGDISTLNEGEVVEIAPSTDKKVAGGDAGRPDEKRIPGKIVANSP